ncbi:TetR/AcrR family transcriptional regulator [Actinorugispora endophytica]|uniref:TetR family transcriptional regulator n=1 Tax=Actinorugispora endophytica TaxID=1605990 RepID=A0A4R6V2J8_9ACTN|nr:TetR/AcrR family transcriptional regulator C-terminal domain-containing protein [Actinorugispora endophytica]TDQ54172.1 TetR family transcriptional regulator [Actinorugispora endophytica]
MAVFAGQGDARRSMALLWRAPEAGGARTGPGPKPGLSVDAIVDAAIAVADEEGMAALSMRAVGERLGRTGMALYTYVQSKSELVDLMYDQALAELPADYDPDADWRAAASSWAADLWAFYLRHPWLLQVSQARSVLGPNEYVMLDTAVRVLRPTGLEARMLRRAVGTLLHFVRGTASTIAETWQAPKATGVSEEEWWYTRSALLTEVAPDFAERFPAVAWLEARGGFRNEDETTPYLEQEARETFEAGLVLLLDGLEAAANRAAPAPGAGRLPRLP